MMRPTMAIVGIIAVVLGAMLFVLGMIPGLFVAVAKGVENLRDHFFQSKGPTPIFQQNAGLYRRFAACRWGSDNDPWVAGTAIKLRTITGRSCSVWAMASDGTILGFSEPTGRLTECSTSRPVLVLLLRALGHVIRAPTIPRRMRTRFIGIGVRPEHVKTPEI
jgi:hypothetical protein